MLPKDEYKKLRDKCKHKFAYARKKGQIEPIGEHTKCVDCGEPAEMYDHRNYYKPLEVEPVCRSCNSQRGQAYPYCEDWAKPRPGNEYQEDEAIDFDTSLAIEFDFNAYEAHQEYVDIFSQDDEVIRFNKWSNIHYYQNQEAMKEHRTKTISHWRKVRGMNWYKQQKVRKELKQSGH